MKGYILSKGKRETVLILIINAVLLGALLGCSAIGLGLPQPIQIRATATVTVRPPFTPRPSDTPWPTFTPVPTVVPVTPGIASGVISSTVNVRIGPGTNYPVVTKLSQGTRINVRGRDVENRWFLLVPPPNGWVSQDYVSIPGETIDLPVVDAPPTLVPTPTFAPSPTPQPTATPQMYIDFRADAPWVMAGQCTTLRWDVEGGYAGFISMDRGNPDTVRKTCAPGKLRLSSYI